MWIRTVTDLQQWRGNPPAVLRRVDSTAPPWASGPSSDLLSHHTASAHDSPPTAVSWHRPVPKCVWCLSESVSDPFEGLAAWTASSGSCWPPAAGWRRPSQSASWTVLPPRHPGRSGSARQDSSGGSECGASGCRRKSGGWGRRIPAILLRYDRAPSQRNLSGSCLPECWPWWSRIGGGSGRTWPELVGSRSRMRLRKKSKSVKRTYEHIILIHFFLWKRDKPQRKPKRRWISIDTATSHQGQSCWFWFLQAVNIINFTAILFAPN